MSDRPTRETEPEANRPTTQPDNSNRGPVEYLRVIVDKQLRPNTDLVPDIDAGYEGERSELYIGESVRLVDGTRQVRLRLQHPDSCVSDISPRLSPRALDHYLRGLVAGHRGTIEQKAVRADDTSEGEQ